MCRDSQRARPAQRRGARRFPTKKTRKKPEKNPEKDDERRGRWAKAGDELRARHSAGCKTGSSTAALW